MAIRCFRDLRAWQLGMALVCETYAVTRAFPPEERYGLAAQMRRAALGIPSNIAEGHQRGTKAYAYFLGVALGSLAELDTQVEAAERLKIAAVTDTAEIRRLIDELGRVLHALRRAVIQRRPNP